ncbi:MAG: hypothetical protein CSA62_10360 [Planctomycetota bacterium]|nr:MAG: hypothetical protein CSA62_10360 [Planctomycetota bacterium]
MPQVEPRFSSRREHIFAFFFCLLVATLAFAPGVGGDWLNFDDPRTVLGNPAFAGDSVDLARILDPSQRIADVYLPVNYLSLGLDVLLHGMSHPLPFQLHSLLLQALAAFVLYLLVRELGLGLAAGLLAAVPLLAHPALCESVLWVSSRKEPLVALFAGLSLLSGLRALRGRMAFWVPALLALLACYSKGSGVALPLLALPLFLWRRAEGWSLRRLGLVLLPMLVICALAALHHWLLAREAGTAEFEAPFAVLPASYLHSWGSFFWPTELAVHHPRAEFLAGAESAAPLPLLVFVTLMAGALWLLLQRRSAAGRLFALGLTLFTAAWAPFNAWFPATALPVADRYLQLPMLGAGLLLAGLSLLLRGELAGRIRFGLTLGLALLLSLLSWRRGGDFADSGTLWRANLKVYPEDAVSWVNLAQWQGTQESVDSAQYQRSVARAAALAEGPYQHYRVCQLQFDLANRSGDGRRIVVSRKALVEATDKLPAERQEAEELQITARYLLSEALVEEGRYQEAQGVLQDLLERSASHVDALGLLASCTMRDTDLGEPKLRVRVAAPLLDRASALPGHEQSYQYQLADAERLFLLGDMRARGAVVRLQQSGLRPKFSSASRIYALSADIFLAHQLIDEAISVLKEGLARWPKAALLHAKLGQLLYASRRFDQAMPRLREAIRLRPGNQKLERLLGSCLLFAAQTAAPTAKPASWKPLVEEAAKLVPEHPLLPLLQSRILFSERMLTEALARAREALKRSPDSEPVQQLVAEILSANGYARLVKGERDEAMHFFRELLEFAPKKYSLGAVREILRSSFLSRLERGKRAARAKAWGEAVLHFRGALALLPENTPPFDEYVNAYGLLGTALYRDLKPEQAVEPFQRLAQLLEKRKQDPGRAVLNAVLAMQQSGMEERARAFALLYLEGEKKDLIKKPELREQLRTAVTR